MKSTSMRWLLCSLGAVVVPFLFTWLCLFIGGRYAPGLVVAYPVCLIVGLISVAMLPIKIAMRVVLCVLYAPGLYLVLSLMGLIYVCGKFGDCL